ncbi:MAG: hypothetical protein JNK05_14395 [Myxococcales bacterium]|nr:hypothetical protein [Myxococcales bacterium]
MTMPARALALCVMHGAVLISCATRGAVARSSSTAQSAPRAPVAATAASVANEARFPSRGCAPESPVVRGFTAQTAPLDALAAAAELPEREASTVMRDGPVVIAWPEAWWPARVDGRDFTAYRVLTGDEDDVVSVYVGDRPSFRAPGGHEFRLASGGTLVRGTLSRQDRRWRLEALALLPCAAPRHVHIAAHSDDPRVIARVARALRALSVERDPGARPSTITLDPAADRARVASLVQPLGEGLQRWILASLEGRELRARYPLATTHPRMDQELIGRASATVGAVEMDLWLSLPVRGGRVEAPAVFAEAAALRGSGISQTLDAVQCRGAAMTVAQDGVALRCEGEPEIRSATSEDDGASALSAALGRAIAARGALRRWRAQPSLFNGYPASMCDPGSNSGAANRNARTPMLVAAEGSVVTARVGRCLLVQQRVETDERLTPLLAVAVEGACAEVPEAPWSSALRAAGRFAALTGQQGQGECRFTAGLRGGRGWVVSANDGESATGPVGQGLAMGVDRAAIARAVGVALELAAMSAGRRDDPPEGVDASVLAALALDRPGTPRARETARRWYTFGGVEGALPVAVFDASSVGTDRARVTFGAFTLDLARTTAPGGWRVTGVERTRW